MNVSASPSVARAAYGILLGGALLWCAAVLAAPLWGESSPAGRFLYDFFRPVCHQLDDRSLHLAGAPLGVCTRCSGIYFAFLAGLLLYPAVRPLGCTSLPHRVLLIVAGLSMVIDVTLSMLGIHESTQLTRLLTGSLFGLTASFFIMPAAAEGTAQLLAPRSRSTHRHHPQQGFTDATET